MSRAFACLFFCLALAPALASAQEPSKKRPKKSEEAEAEWKTVKYYRARFETDLKAHEEERDKEAKIRLVQNLPVAKDGLPVLAAGAEAPKATPTAAEVTGGGGIAAVEGPVDAASLLEAQKKRAAEEKRTKELEAAKAKLLGDQRDAKGQVIDEDPTDSSGDCSAKKGRAKKKCEKAKKNSPDEDE
jgi:hypothetical protein